MHVALHAPHPSSTCQVADGLNPKCLATLPAPNSAGAALATVYTATTSGTIHRSEATIWDPDRDP